MRLKCFISLEGGKNKKNTAKTRKQTSKQQKTKEVLADREL